LAAWKARNLSRYEPVVDDLTGLIVGREYNAEMTLSGVLAIVMARVKPIAINYAIFVNPFATYVVKTAQIHSWWYEEIAWIVPAQRNSSLPHAYISVLNEWSQLVLPTVPNFRLGSGSGANPEPDSCNRFYHMRTRTIAIGPVLAPKSRHFNPTNLVPIEYLSSHRIMT